MCPFVLKGTVVTVSHPIGIEAHYLASITNQINPVAFDGYR